MALAWDARRGAVILTRPDGGDRVQVMSIRTDDPTVMCQRITQHLEDGWTILR